MIGQEIIHLVDLIEELAHDTCGEEEPDCPTCELRKICPTGMARQAEAAAVQSSPKPKRTTPSAGSRQGHLNEIAEHLGDRLNTRVKVTLGASKGTIVIDFATVADLNRILAELGQEGFGK